MNGSLYHTNTPDSLISGMKLRNEPCLESIYFKFRIFPDIPNIPLDASRSRLSTLSFLQNSLEPILRKVPISKKSHDQIFTKTAIPLAVWVGWTSHCTHLKAGLKTRRLPYLRFSSLIGELLYIHLNKLPIFSFKRLYSPIEMSDFQE